MKKYLEVIQGKKINIKQIKIEYLDDRLILLMNVVVDNLLLSLFFHNISRLSLRDLSSPLEIHGFEIKDNKNFGWDNCLRYSIRDFEDDRIRFNCENIECFVSEL